jgi:signal transduction histidine kinase
MPIGSSGDLLSFIAAGTAGAVGEQFFQCLVEHLALAFGADVAFAAELAPDSDDRATFLACWESGALIPEPAAYELAGTPCSEFGESDLVTYVGGLPARYPDDRLIVEQGLESYLGVAVRDSAGTRIGHVGVLARAPVQPDRERVDVLRIFAARAGAEIERRRREAMFRELADEQAALRRVATLVATEVPQQDVFDSVTREVGELLDADGSSLVRWDGERAHIVATWSREGFLPACIGPIDRLDAGSATSRALHLGEPARADGLEHSTDPSVIAQGIRSAVAAPIRVGGRVWGVVRAASKGSDPVGHGAERRLADFAELVAQAIANTDAREELAASRLRIVEAGDTERRRIERNLHDGAQQRLVSLRLALTLAAKRLADDGAAGPVVAEAAEELAVALDELRELARGIHPAILSDHGLVAAVEALSARSPVEVEVVAATIGQLPEAVEATAYFVVAEALTNVAKYAGATAAAVHMSRDVDVLRVEVRDDGCGGADVGAGSGLRGLDDRVQALGGTLRVTSPAGRGTVVTAEIPAAADASQRPRSDAT